jgi:hypothetical protein
VTQSAEENHLVELGRLASPTIENSNRLIGWLRGMEGLRRALGAA